MGRRHLTPEQCSTFADFDSAFRSAGCSLRNGKGHIVVDGPNGYPVAVHARHGEPGPHTRSALRKVLAALLLLVPLACGLAALALKAWPW
jgi:hypothetical protein